MVIRKLARTAYWLGWHHFGPAGGVGPEDRRPPRTVLHGGVHRRDQHRPVRGDPARIRVSARELSMVRNRRIDLKKLNSAIAIVVNEFDGVHYGGSVTWLFRSGDGGERG
jgi:hypothetical protein